MWRRVGRFLRLVALGLLALMVIGFTYQVVASAVDAHRFPAPGRLIDVGGRRLQIRCEGTGQPTVVLEAGLGSSSLDWSLVAPELAKGVRVCAYDRAGLGWSDASPGPRTAVQVASDLHTLLEKAGEPGPYVLVAHSIGGLYARLFAARYPQAVGAVVLVDPMNEDPLPPQARAELDPAVVQQLDAKVHQAYGIMSTLSGVAAYTSGIGLPRLLTALDAVPGSIAGQLPAAVRAQYRAVSSSSRFFDTVYRESASTEASISEVKAAPFPPHLPLYILRPQVAATEGATGLPPAVVEALRRYAGVEPLLALSSQSSVVIVEKTGHYIQLDQPQAVIAAVQRAVAAVKR